MLFSKRLLVFCTALACTNAAVIGIEKQEERLDRVMRRDTATISQGLLTKFQLFANYTAASYCPGNENQTAGTPITCPDGECGIAEADSPIAVVEFGVDNTTTAIKGYLATSMPTSLIVLAFAGSGNTVRNWITDFNFLQVATDLCASCSIHTGFNTAWSERRSLILDALSTTLSLHPDFDIVITGHSIGAAVATLAAAEIREVMNLSVDLYTFGSPRVGNEAFAEFVTNQAPGLGENYRVTHVNDPVPQIPPTWVGYEHVSPEYWLSTGTDTTDVYSVEDVVICEGVGNTGCNAGTGLVPIDGTAHNHYLGDISACQAGLEYRR